MDRWRSSLRGRTGRSRVVAGPHATLEGADGDQPDPDDPLWWLAPDRLSVVCQDRPLLIQPAPDIVDTGADDDVRLVPVPPGQRAAERPAARSRTRPRSRDNRGSVGCPRRDRMAAPSRTRVMLLGGCCSVVAVIVRRCQDPVGHTRHGRILILRCASGYPPRSRQRRELRAIELVEQLAPQARPGRTRSTAARRIAGSCGHQRTGTGGTRSSRPSSASTARDLAQCDADHERLTHSLANAGCRILRCPLHRHSCERSCFVSRSSTGSVLSWCSAPARIPASSPSARWSARSGIRSSCESASTCWGLPMNFIPMSMVVWTRRPTGSACWSRRSRPPSAPWSGHCSITAVATTISCVRCCV